jgi:hypothetical protein
MELKRVLLFNICGEKCFSLTTVVECLYASSFIDWVQNFLHGFLWWGSLVGDGEIPKPIKKKQNLRGHVLLNKANEIYFTLHHAMKPQRKEVEVSM